MCTPLNWWEIDASFAWDYPMKKKHRPKRHSLGQFFVYKMKVRKSCRGSINEITLDLLNQIQSICQIDSLNHCEMVFLSLNTKMKPKKRQNYSVNICARAHSI